MYGAGQIIQFHYTAWVLVVLLTNIACTPTVKVEPPDHRITINLNIKLDADIRVKLEEDAKKDIAANPGIF
mgnify:FL=1